MRTLFPLAIVGQPFSCAGVGAAKFRSNQARVSGRKTDSASIPRAYRDEHAFVPDSPAAPGYALHMPGREERKVVTILFTDLVGSTAMAEGRDPEDVRAILTPYYTRLREQIEQRGGTVEKFIGDAVMAVFGAPVAHEDDPIRAVLAALAIRDSIGDELQIRTAVNTGEALVALDADVTAGEAFVSGDVVNTAARLQSAAPVNGI